MQLCASFRELTKNDISREVPMLLEPEEFEVHFQAIVQDIAALDGVTDVLVHEHWKLTITTSGLSFDSFKAHLKPVLQQHFEYARLSSLDIV